jgi:hypothetical protein
VLRTTFQTERPVSNESPEHVDIKYPLEVLPLTIRGHRLKNRIIMGSTHSGLEDLPNAAERLSPTSSSA